MVFFLRNFQEQAKNESYPRKDLNGRLLIESSCLPFILTSMGGLCEEGHEFLRVCRKRNLEKTTYMIDVLVTQHAKWIAGSIRRALFGQASFSKLVDHRNLGGIVSRQKKKTPMCEP